MSRQLTFSATVCALTMALFALASLPGSGEPMSNLSPVSAFAASASLD